MTFYFVNLLGLNKCLDYKGILVTRVLVSVCVSFKEVKIRRNGSPPGTITLPLYSYTNSGLYTVHVCLYVCLPSNRMLG